MDNAGYRCRNHVINLSMIYMAHKSIGSVEGIVIRITFTHNRPICQFRLLFGTRRIPEIQSDRRIAFKQGVDPGRRDP